MWPPLRMALALFGLSAVLVSVACIPGLDAVVFSGHGGPGWLALASCFPVFLVNAYRWIVRRDFPVLSSRFSRNRRARWRPSREVDEMWLSNFGMQPSAFGRR